LEYDDLEIGDEDDSDLLDAWQVGGKVKYELAHLDLDRWLIDLANDRAQLSALYEEARKVSVARDAKLGHLKDLLRQKVQHPSVTRDGRSNRKVLVFTAFADTARYLYDVLKELARKELKGHIAMVSGGATPNLTTFGTNDFNHILTNFSPLSKSRAKMRSMPQDEEIDILIATDCISEGQNLQDCDTLINYDIHWNPVRIIQRFGRIDRIGSRNQTVHLVNFWPTRDLDSYIALKDRVEARMALVDIAATQEDNLLQEEIRELVEGELKYRDKQLKRLRDEILDLEEIDEGVSLNEFTLDDFRIELANYIEANRKALEEAPLGLYAVVPPATEGAAAQVGRPGVIFCLRQIGDTSGNEQVNPLQPCYLVYVRDDGEVRLNFTQAKHILELFRTVAAGQTSAFEALCTLFDQQTGNGSAMGQYDTLLHKAVQAITHTFRKRNIGGLLAGRDGKLVAKAKQVSGADDFELVTWLVIKEK
jgi:hypothetical protein